jgi:hypothetical protein
LIGVACSDRARRNVEEGEGGSSVATTVVYRTAVSHTKEEESEYGVTRNTKERKDK